MLHISIPKPCNADWEGMSETPKGAFCQLCAKEVIDFTHMTDDAVKLYLLSISSNKACGRFRQDQLARIKIYLPANILKTRIAGWKKWIAIILLAFGSTLTGCDVIMSRPSIGKVLIKQTSAKRPIGDTVYTATVGAIVMPVERIEKNTTTCGEETMGEIEPTLLGKIAMTEAVFDTATDIMKDTMDTLTTANKNPADTTDCGNQNFY